MIELWKAIPGNRDYEVSNQGRVRSIDRTTIDSSGRVARLRGRILKQQISTPGYPTVTLRLNKKATSPREVHSLVMLAFVGPVPKGQLVRHRDGTRTNCTLSNLRYGTPAQNMQDAIEHGTTTPGMKNAMAKLTDANVIEIRRLCGTGLSDTAVAKLFDVSRPSITYIRQRKTWRHI